MEEIIEKKARIFCLGDIHGGYKAMEQCFERSGFDKEKDTLIQLGDICDGFDEVFECVEELLAIKNLIAIRGNHDDWFFTYIKTGMHPDHWQQGGRGTLKSYMERSGLEFVDGPSQFSCPLVISDIPESHREFFYNQKFYYVDEERRIFVHGGFNRHISIEENSSRVFFWDRDLFQTAMSYKQVSEFENNKGRFSFKMKDGWKEVFIGHTSTLVWQTTEPIHTANIWNIDTGCGFSSGKLTIMDVETKKYWQSDLLESLYPGQQSR